MLKIKQILAVLSLFVLWQMMPKGQEGVQYAFGPLATLAVSAGIGALAGGLSRKKRREFTEADLDKYKFPKYDATAEKAKLIRNADAMLKKRRSLANEKASSMGLDPVQASFSNEEDIHNALLDGLTQIDELDRKNKEERARILLQLNESQPEDESAISAILGGAIQGAGLGTKLYNAFDSGASPAPNSGLTSNQVMANDMTNPLNNDAGGMVLNTIGGEKKGLSSDDPLGIGTMKNPAFNMTGKGFNNSNIYKFLGALK